MYKETGSTNLASIYKLIDPLPSKIVYIGRTIQPLEIRRRQHVHLSRHGMSAQAPVYGWIRSLSQEGRQPQIVELDRVLVTQAITAEDEWMALYRASGHHVLNRCSSATGGKSRGIYQQKRPVGYGYRGVTRNKYSGRWHAAMSHKGIHQHLGSYETAEEAAHAYDQAAVLLFGASAILNFPLNQLE